MTFSLVVAVLVVLFLLESVNAPPKGGSLMNVPTTPKPKK